MNEWLNPSQSNAFKRQTIGLQSGPNTRQSCLIHLSFHTEGLDPPSLSFPYRSYTKLLKSATDFVPILTSQYLFLLFQTNDDLAILQMKLFWLNILHNSLFLNVNFQRTQKGKKDFCILNTKDNNYTGFFLMNYSYHAELKRKQNFILKYGSCPLKEKRNLESS